MRPISDSDLQAYVDGALSTARQAEVAAYLDAHPAEAERIGDYIAQRDAVRAAYAPIIDEAVPAELDIAALIAARHDRRSGMIARLTPRVAVVAALLLIGGVTGWQLNTWNHRLTPDCPRSPARRQPATPSMPKIRSGPWRSAPMTARR